LNIIAFDVHVLSDVNEYNSRAAILAQGQGRFSCNRGVFNDLVENLTPVLGDLFSARLSEQAQNIVTQIKVGFLTQACHCFGYV
jgi:hypothetical protein